MYIDEIFLINKKGTLNISVLSASELVAPILWVLFYFTITNRYTINKSMMMIKEKIKKSFLFIQSPPIFEDAPNY